MNGTNTMDQAREDDLRRPDGRSIYRRRLASGADIVDIEKYAVEDLRPGATIHASLAHWAERTPEKAAMVFLDEPDLLVPKQSFTFTELVAGIEQAASVFCAAAGEVPPVVGVLLPMLPAGLISLWGAQSVGIAVPMNPFLGFKAVAGIMNDTQATVLVTTREVLEEKSASAFEEMWSAVPNLKRIFLVDDVDPALDLATAMAAYAGKGLPGGFSADPDRTSMIMPTGGTTGSPKLVQMCQAGQLTVGWNVSALMGPREDGVVAHGMPNFHVGGTISLGLRCLMFGQTLLTLTPVGFRSTRVIEEFWTIAETFKVTSLLATPATALALLHHEKAPAGPTPVEDFHVGGSPLPMDLVEAFHNRFGVWLRENWGMTELHGTVTGHPNDFTMPRVGSAGVPLPNFSVRAVKLGSDQRWASDCRAGERGLLLVGGPTITSGYLDASLDEGFFIDGVPGGEVWANTGDLGTVDEDGYVWVFGRAKDLIIRGGHNIDPREIEDALVQHPTVHIAAAVGRPHPSKGEMPVAYVELKDGFDAAPDELLTFCRDHVQERAAVPVSIVVLDRMPLTPVGKVSKPVLRKDALEREVRAVVEEVLGSVECQVRIDESGPRLVARVELAADESTDADSEVLRQRLRRYEFGSQVVGAR